MKTPAQWSDIYPVAQEVVAAIQEDALNHAMIAYEAVLHDVILGIRKGLTEPEKLCTKENIALIDDDLVTQ